MKRWLLLVLGASVVSVVHAGPILNGDFETGALTYWNSAESLALLPDPKVASGLQSGGINGPSGQAADDFAVLNTTYPDGNFLGNTVWTSIAQSNVTWGGVTGTLEVRLTDVGDPRVPTGNYSGALLDNFTIRNVSGVDQLSFNWYALTKKDIARNDYLQVLFNGQQLWRFDYNSTQMPTSPSGGGGGTTFGPFSYGTGWQTTTVTTSPPVPEPATWGVLCCGMGAMLVRKRRRPTA